MHLVWLSLLVPPMVFGALWIPWLRHAVIWRVILAVAALGLAVMFAMDYVQITGTGKSYSWNRVLYSLLTLTDIPLIALVVGWIFGSSTSRWLRGRSLVVADQSESESAEVSLKTVS